MGLGLREYVIGWEVVGVGGGWAVVDGLHTGLGWVWAVGGWLGGGAGAGEKEKGGDVGSGACIFIAENAALRPEESLGGRRPFHGVKERFLSDHYDYQSAHTIEGKCVVHSFKNYTKLESVGTEDYFCRFEYKAATGGFTPDRVVVYCKCEMPYNPDDLMVQCEECKDSSHPACMGMTIEDAKKLERFLCSDCASDDDAKGQLNSFPVSSSTEVKVESKRRKR
ncbi:hypothetical protein M8C21_022309 [Ambrosia artemisiifolia]|uniref:BAH domain-containing protein n=1 Tax=Ambrosia artemisiifolia TaxID=4212 RepID=A0AAD5BXH0_AMBAR|nr:hypothetical protein M8C21_022309 [Ambrosia artemisiifolia]